MTPGFNKASKNLTAITFGLVAILLFVRINPIYYVAQFVPVRYADAHSTPAVRRADNNHGLLRCQRAISERIETVAVPQIRFTGIPFIAVFVPVTAQLKIGIVNFLKRRVVSGTRRIALLRSLRL